MQYDMHKVDYFKLNCIYWCSYKLQLLGQCQYDEFKRRIMWRIFYKFENTGTSPENAQKYNHPRSSKFKRNWNSFITLAS